MTRSGGGLRAGQYPLQCGEPRVGRHADGGAVDGGSRQSGTIMANMPSVGKPGKSPRMVLYLASDEAMWVTSQTFPIDGA